MIRHSKTKEVNTLVSGSSIAVKDTMTTATLFKNILLRRLIKSCRGSAHYHQVGATRRHGTGDIAEISTSIRQQESMNSLSGILNIENLKTCPSSDTLYPTRPYPLQ